MGNKVIRYIDLFAGMGGNRVALEQALQELGFKGECVMTSEIKPYAIDVYKENFNNEEVRGDITQIESSDIPDFDIMLASTPCFTSDTLVLTDKGYKEIKDIEIGDKVLSHDNEYHSVTNVMNQGVKNIVSVKAMGFDEIRTTNNHKFYVREIYRIWDNDRRTYVRCFKEPEWLTIETLKEKDDTGKPNYKKYYLGSAINQNSIIPKWNGIDIRVNQFKTKHINTLDMQDTDLWYLAGRYLGDGWLRKNRKGKNRSQIGGAVICCGKHKATEFENKISSKYNYCRVEERTNYKYHFSNTELGWFLSQFGEMADGKFIPVFVFDMPVFLLKSLLDGYLDSDGSYEKNSDFMHITSVSKLLIYGVEQCVMKVFQRPCSILKIKTKDTTIIEGRLVNQKDYYRVRFKKESHKQDHAFFENDIVWYPISSILDTNSTEEVWDISVETSQSFTANNCIVHNCQSFSIAGARRGFEDTRGTLFFDVARILKDKQPQAFFIENVEGLVDHGLTREDRKKGKKVGPTLQTMLDILEELGYKVSWNVLAASDFGVAQIRRRIYIVGTRDNKVNIYNFEKSEVNFGEIQERGLPTLDTAFTRAIKEYLTENNLTWECLYDKAIRDKRGSSNNIHSWTLGLRGKVSEKQHDFLEKLVTERRKKEYAQVKGYSVKDGLGLTTNEISNFSEITVDELEDLVSKKYLKKTNLDGKFEIYDINGGKLSFEFAKILDPNKPTLTLVATDVAKMAVVDGDGLRRLTLKEGLRLNGYPEDYKLNIDYKKGMDLLGNTVVVPVVKSILHKILTV